MVLGLKNQLKQYYRFLSKIHRRSLKKKKRIKLEFFLDFTKAYDVLNHKVLLSKLNSYGMRDVTNSWFESYL